MIIFAGILLVLIWGSVSFISQGISLRIYENIASVFPPYLLPYIEKIRNGFHYDVPNKQMPAEVFFVLFTISFLIYLFIIFAVCRQEKPTNSFIPILLFAILFRMILLPSVLIHENDIYRYVWDGKVSISGVNPYKYAPIAAESRRAYGKDGRDSQVLTFLKEENRVYFERIGHKDVPTIYPPVAQAIFAFSSFIGRDSIVFMKFIFILFDILIIFVIYRLLLRFEINPNRVIIYAWSPLVLKEFANSGHCDSIAIALLAVALFFFFSRKEKTSYIYLALAGLSKFFPLVVIPFFVKKTKLKSFFLVPLILVAAYVPFFFLGGIGAVNAFKGLLIYAKIWAIDGAIFESLYLTLGFFLSGWSLDYFVLSKVIVGGAYLCILIYLFLKESNTDVDYLNKIFWALAWMFLLSPTGNPWYFCWLIPFLCFFPYRSFLLLSWMIIFNYLSFTTDVGNIEIANITFNWITLTQYTIFFLMLFKESVASTIKVKGVVRI